MSGFALVFHTSPGQTSLETLQNAGRFLKHRGTDTIGHFQTPTAAMIHYSQWKTPEDIGEQQPLLKQANQHYFLFDGRIDNRVELLDALKYKERSQRTISDATLAFDYLEYFGKEALGNIIGPFALAWLQSSTKTLLLARDPMGNRSLFYHQGRGFLAAASEERALLAVAELAPSLCEERVASYFSFSTPTQATFFQGVRELQPGQQLTYHKQIALKAFWQSTQSPSFDYRNENLVIEKFYWLLNQAVKDRCRSLNQPGMMLSGGLDSSTIACFLANSDKNFSYKAFSYVFPQTPASNEQRNIEALAQQLNLRSFHTPGDKLHPITYLLQGQVNPNSPEENLYRTILLKLQQQALQQNCQVLLTGDFGDHHFADYFPWLYHAWRYGSKSEWPGLLWRDIKQHGLRTSLRRMGLGDKSHLLPAKAAPSYLTDEAKRIWHDSQQNRHWQANLPLRQTALFSSFSARSFSQETHRCFSLGIDLRHPYRDLRLVEFSLGLPAHYLYRGGISKWLLRKLQTHFKLNERPEPNKNLQAFFETSMRQSHKEIKQMLRETQNDWSVWVKPSDVMASIEHSKTTAQGKLLWWYCLCFSKWFQNIFS